MNTFPSTQILREAALCHWIDSYHTAYVLLGSCPPHATLAAKKHDPKRQKFIVQSILPLCSNMHIAYAFYYECKLYTDQVYKDLSKKMFHMHPYITEHIVATDTLVRYVNHIVDGERFSIKLPAKLPYDPSTTVLAVNDPVQLQTATRPSVITMKTNKDTRYILVKKDDLTKDRLVMHVAHLIEKLCDTKCVQYPVFVTPKVDGSNAARIQNAVRTQIRTLQSYLQRVSRTRRAVREEKVYSLCRRSVHTFVFARRRGQAPAEYGHFQGELAHIDFSYILGYDPKLHMDIRITTPMIQMMGGEHSRDYASFVHGVTEAFHKIRQHTGLWYALMTFLSTNYSLVEIQEHVTRKLMPSVQDARATMRIVDIVKNNSNTWRHNISDITHQIFQMDF